MTLKEETSPSTGANEKEHTMSAPPTADAVVHYGEPVPSSKVDDHTATIEAAIAAPVITVDTIDPKVNFNVQDRTVTDKWFGVLFVASYLAFLATGFFIVGNAHPKWKWAHEEASREISDYFEDEVEQCCNGHGRGNLKTFGICEYLPSAYDNGNRKLDIYYSDDKPDQFKLAQGEGLFDAFLEVPEVPVTMTLIVLVIAFGWMALLRFFSREIVYATEVIKAGIFYFAGIYILIKADDGDTGGTTFSVTVAFLIGTGILAFAFWRRQKLAFAAKMISNSTVAMEQNTNMFSGVLVVNFIFVLHSLLFVWFFVKSFENVEVKQTLDFDTFSDNYGCEVYNEDGSCEKYYTYAGSVDCEYVWPGYASSISVFHCFAWLWITLFFHKVRLSIIAYFVGSWHFHPEDKPTVLVAVTNSISKSFGTLAAGSLISAILDKVNRKMTEPCWKLLFFSYDVLIMATLKVLLCIFGTCLHQIIKSLTKFSIIIHAFTGLPFYASGKKCSSIMSRHYENGFVTEYSSRSVLWLGSYTFSYCIFLLSWVWFDESLNSQTGPGRDDSGGLYIIWILFGFFNVWHPVLAIYLLIWINSLLEKSSYNPEDWVSPLCAMFVACLSMIFFTFVADVVLDIVDVMFVCYAVDKDNKVVLDPEVKEVFAVIESVPGYIPVARLVDDERNDIELGVNSPVVAPAETISK